MRGVPITRPKAKEEETVSEAVGSYDEEPDQAPFAEALRARTPWPVGPAFQTLAPDAGACA